MGRRGSGALPTGDEPEADPGFQWEYHQGGVRMRNSSRIFAILVALGALGTPNRGSRRNPAPFPAKHEFCAMITV